MPPTLRHCHDNALPPWCHHQVTWHDLLCAGCRIFLADQFVRNCEEQASHDATATDNPEGVLFLETSDNMLSALVQHPYDKVVVEHFILISIESTHCV